MLLRWVIALSLLVGSVGAVVRYDMSKDELLKELGKPTSILAKSGREVLIYPNNVRIEIEHGKVVSVKGIDLAAAAEVPAAPIAAAAEPKEGEATAAPEEAGDAEPKLTPAEQKAQAEAEAKREKEMAAANAKARADMEKAITDMENPAPQPSLMAKPAFEIGGFLIELAVKWLLMLAALKLTAKYWSVDIEWPGLMIAAAADTAVRAVILGIGEGAMGLYSVFYADEALAAIVLVLVLRKVSTNQSLQQAVTITLTSKVFSIVVGSFLSVVILRALN
jgi:hypothetical protein